MRNSCRNRWLIPLAALLVAPAALAAQTRVITGTVTRSTGGPVVGASVLQSAVGRATATTNEQGHYSITVPDGEAKLTIRAIGFRSQTATVPGNVNTLDVALLPDAFKLDEVVITGQQTGVERRNATTSTSVVGGDELTEVPAATVDKALQGKVAGAIISQNSGAPGGGIQIQIRGNNTIIGSSDPLFVVDGVIVSNATIPTGLSTVTGSSTNRGSGDAQDDAVNRLADLNPNDIESIEVLKSAAAGAIYGSKASNGVVIIHTKKGRAGKTRTNVTQRFGFYSLLRGYAPRVFDTTTAFAQFGRDVVAPYLVNGALPVFDHTQEAFGNKPLSYETQLSNTGGDANTKYFLSGGWKYDGGIMQNTGAGRQNLRFNIDQTLSPKLKLSVTSAFSRNLSQRGFTNNDNLGASVSYALAYIPSFIPLTPVNGVYPQPAITYKGANPLQTAALGRNDETTTRFTSGASLSYDAYATEHSTLKLVTAAGADFFSSRSKIFAPPELYFQQSSPTPGVVTIGNADSRFLNWNANAIHTYAPASNSFKATTSLGVQYEDQNQARNSATALGLLPGQDGINQGSVFTGALEARAIERTFALYVQEEFLTLGDRLLLSAGGRAEKASNNGNTGKYYFFPRASASYRFPEALGKGSEVKLRGAFGATGNRPTFGNKFTTLATTTIGGAAGTPVGGVAGDPNIKPERLREFEGGIDVSFADGRATFEVTAYNRKVTDLLLDVAAIPSSGFARRFTNDASMRTNGLEVAAGWSPIQTANTSWLVRSTFTMFRNKVLTLPAEIPLDGGYRPQFAGFGTAYGEFFVSRGKPVDQIIGQVVDTVAGTAKDSSFGRASPDFRLTLSNDFRYKNLTFSFLWDWQQGGLAQNQTLSLYDCNNLAPDGNLPSGRARNNACNIGDARPFVESTTFLKLRELSVGLQLPRSVASLFGTTDARATVTGRNLLLFTKYTGYDPESSNYGQQAVTRNIDLGVYPPSRSFFFSINLGY